MRGRELHRLGHAGRAAVERASKNIREAEDVVDLVGEVAAAGGDERVGARRDRIGIADLGVGVREREDDRALRHRLEPLGLDRVRDRQAHEHVGAAHRVLERAAAVVGDREARLVRVQILASIVDDALAVDEHDVLALDAERDEELDACDRARARARHDQLERLELLVRELDRVEHAGTRDDRGAVLVVVEHRDAHALAQLPLDLEAGGRGDVLEVDAAERRLE